MNKKQLNSAFDALTPNEAQKRRMLERVLQADTPIQRNHKKNFIYIGAPVLASLVLCVSLVAFTLTRGGNQPALPSDALAEVGNTTSRTSTSSGASSTHDSDPSSEVHNSTATSKLDATVSAKAPSASSKAPFESSSETQSTPSISSKPTENSKPPVSSESPESSEPPVPPEMPDNPYDFSDVSVDYTHVSIKWDDRYVMMPPTSSEDENILGDVGIDGKPCSPDSGEDATVLWLGDRRYTVPTDDDLLGLILRYGETSIGERIAVTPSGEAVYRVGETDDVLAVRNPLETWTYFCFDGFAENVTGRDALAVYGAVSPDTFSHIFVGSLGKHFEVRDGERLRAFYDSLYRAKCISGENGRGEMNLQKWVHLVVHLQNGHLLAMWYDPDAGLLYHGGSAYAAGKNTALGDAIESLVLAN